MSHPDAPSEGCAPVEEKFIEIAAWAARRGVYEKAEDALRTGLAVIYGYLITFDYEKAIICIRKFYEPGEDVEHVAGLATG